MKTVVPLYSATLLALLCVGTSASAAEPAASASPVTLRRNDRQGQLQILVAGQEALIYQYGAEVDLPHYYPVRSPSGKLLTIQRTDPYPHHRSIWFADTVQLAGQRQTSFYMGVYSGRDAQPPYRDRVRHVEFTKTEMTPGGATIVAKLRWEADAGKLPVMDEARELRVVALGQGEYFLDCRFALTAAYGAVTFKSDSTHYAWPYIRMHPQFAVEAQTVEKIPGVNGQKPQEKIVGTKSHGTLTNSEGAVNQKDTLMKPARWVDYSATVGGVTEGLTVFADPQQPPPRFFTRDYGCFGPRRPDDRSGKPFVLPQGETLKTRVGILVHRGDVSAGQVVARYEQFAAGKL